MSRQILSYADLGPITSVTTPIPGPSSPLPRPQPPHDDEEGEPPRKRLRTNNEEDDDSLPKDGNNTTSVHINGNKRKKVQRHGNPSGVPWTRHWDAQPFSGGNAGQALVYEEDDTTVPSSRNNASSSKAMPPPPPSFIGPVVPSSNAAGKGKGRRKGKNGRANKTNEAISMANEEEWDDSALIDAWNAAEEEYRVSGGVHL
jgi:hypothetical protein